MFVLRLKLKRGLGFFLMQWFLLMRKLEEMKASLRKKRFYRRRRLQRNVKGRAKAQAPSRILTRMSLIYKYLLLFTFEKSHMSKESLDTLLRKAVTYVPQAEVLWLMGAKEKWLAGDVPAARAILQEAYAAIPNSEEIWLAAFKLEFENKEPERARMLLAKARERGGTERVWMKSAIVERELGHVEAERRLINEGLKQFPRFFKLWLMLGQLEERFNHQEQARKAYESGLKHCPECVPLWLVLGSYECCFCFKFCACSLAVSYFK